MLYRADIEAFVKDIEINVCLPKLIEAIKPEVNLILKITKEKEQQLNSNLSPEQVEAVSEIILRYLKQNNLTIKDIQVSDLIDYVISDSKKTISNSEYDFLDFSEIKALEALLGQKYANPFPVINQQQIELDLSIKQIPSLESQIEQMKAQITGRDYTLLKAYEENEANIKRLEKLIDDIVVEITKIDKRLHQFDIQTNQEPDPKYEALGKLKAFFDDVANKLLKAKKQQIENKMKQDLNINLAAYKDVIARVELSENLSNLTFKIYHKSGNEIYLNQLNTASKQVVVQVLLKALHEYGDYDPPVMIDTVMGVLDENSRATVLENYFPELSHQTILLSSDSEIRPHSDLDKIDSFISKSFTLIRDREKQLTEIQPGYFGFTQKD
jgi:DNA sulfur modification protein DndD